MRVSRNAGAKLTGMEVKDVSARVIYSSPEFDQIVRDYCEESGNPDLGEAVPALDFYERMEQADAVRCAAAYEGERIVGIVVVVTTLYPHFGKRIASVESLWLDRKHRAGGAGLKLIRKAQALAREMGAVGIYYGARSGSRLAQLYGRLFTPMNSLFWKKL